MTNQKQQSDWKHSSNEWANMAVNGLQYLKNVRDNMSDIDNAIENLESQLSHCKEISKAASQATTATSKAETAYTSHSQSYRDVCGLWQSGIYIRCKR